MRAAEERRRHRPALDDCHQQAGDRDEPRKTEQAPRPHVEGGPHLGVGRWIETTSSAQLARANGPTVPRTIETDVERRAAHVVGRSVSGGRSSRRCRRRRGSRRRGRGAAGPGTCGDGPAPVRVGSGRPGAGHVARPPGQRSRLPSRSSRAGRPRRSRPTGRPRRARRRGSGCGRRGPRPAPRRPPARGPASAARPRSASRPGSSGRRAGRCRRGSAGTSPASRRRRTAPPGRRRRCRGWIAHDLVRVRARATPRSSAPARRRRRGPSAAAP